MLAFATLGLAGCALALIAIALDWREQRHGRIGWTYTTTRGVE